MNCYFCDNIGATSAVVTLDELESRHAVTSRRQQVGDEIVLVNGKGMRAKGVIDSMTRAKVNVQIKSCLQIDRQKPEVILASALPKGERQKVMFDMMSQLGVDRFVPLCCERSVVRPSSTTVGRWSRICLQACKQSHNPFLPRIEHPDQPVSFAKKMTDKDIPVWAADPTGRPMTWQGSKITAALCIGPEGGFSDEEKDGMHEAGVRFFCLGNNILRIETAAVVSIQTIRQCFQFHIANSQLKTPYQQI